jgi:hypothetical protein
MSLYLLIAIALGAITGVAEAPVARPVLSIASRRETRRAEQRVMRVGTAFAPRRTAAAPKFASLLFARCEAPLTGAATPRAPAE